MLKLPIPLIKVLLKKVDGKSRAELKSITPHYYKSSLAINLTEEEGKTYLWLMDMVSLSILGWYNLGTLSNVRVKHFGINHIYIDSYCRIEISLKSFTSTLTNYKSDYYQYINKLKELYLLLYHSDSIIGSTELDRIYKDSIINLNFDIIKKIKQHEINYSTEMINYIKELCGA